MRILKFTGATSRDVLAQVRSVLGDEALIISNQRTDKGLIEILAADPRSIAADTPGQPQPSPNPASASSAPTLPSASRSSSAPPASTDRPAPTAPVRQAIPRPAQYAPAAQPPFVPLSPQRAAQSHISQQPIQPPASTTTAASRPATQPPAAEPLPRVPRQPAQPVPTSPSTSQPVPQPITGPDLAKALKNLQGDLAERFNSLMWGNELKRSPLRTTLLRELLETGLSMELARELLMNCPQAADAHSLRLWLRQTLASRLKTPQPQQDLLTQPGIYALVGPTGVGKTTTVAKLAARCVTLHGRGSIALVTTDSYRIAAHEQLQAFGRLMGVPVYPTRSDADLGSLLQRLSDKPIILIDNMGLSQRDVNVARQMQLLAQAGLPVRRVLVLNAASQGDTLEEVVNTYGRPPLATPPSPGSAHALPSDRHGASGITDCIISKVDEATRIGPAIDTAIRHGLTVHYITDGQKVPDQLRMPTAADLVDLALSGHASAPALFVPDEAGLAALVSHASGTPDAPSTHQTRTNSAEAAHESESAPHAPSTRTCLPWLLHRDGDQSPSHAMQIVEKAVTWANGDCATRLAREAWQHWAQAQSGQPVSSAAAPASVRLQASHWSKAAREASSAPEPLLAIHGKASLAPQLPKAALSCAILADEHGHALSVPVQSLVSQFGLYSIAGGNGGSGGNGGMEMLDDATDLPSAQLQWLDRQLPQATLIHVFESLTATQLHGLRQLQKPHDSRSDLQPGVPHWIAPAPGALKVNLSQEASQQPESIKSLASRLGFMPLPPQEGDDNLGSDNDSWWFAQAEVSLRPTSASSRPAVAATDGGTESASTTEAKDDAQSLLRLLVLKRPAQAGEEPVTLTILSNIPISQVSPVRVARWYLRSLSLRPAFKYMAQAWSTLGSSPEAEDIWLRRALAAGQIGTAAWQATHAPQAASMQDLLSLAGGWNKQSSARAVVQALLRSFAFMEMSAR